MFAIGILLAISLVTVVPVPSYTDELVAEKLTVDLPADIRAWYGNPDGSCVQCSIGMRGADQTVPAAATPLWNTEYGPAQRRLRSFACGRLLRPPPHSGLQRHGPDNLGVDEMGGASRAAGRRRSAPAETIFRDARGLRRDDRHLVRLQQQQSPPD